MEERWKKKERERERERERLAIALIFYISIFCAVIKYTMLLDDQETHPKISPDDYELL